MHLHVAKKLTSTNYWYLLYYVRFSARTMWRELAFHKKCAQQSSNYGQSVKQEHRLFYTSAVISIFYFFRPRQQYEILLSFIRTSQFSVGKFIPAIFLLNPNYTNLEAIFSDVFFLKMEENSDFCLLYVQSAITFHF